MAFTPLGLVLSKRGYSKKKNGTKYNLSGRERDEANVYLHAVFHLLLTKSGKNNCNTKCLK
jgi:hypothetical protein